MLQIVVSLPPGRTKKQRRKLFIQAVRKINTTMGRLNVGKVRNDRVVVRGRDADIVLLPIILAGLPGGYKRA